ncbi:MAG: SIR2 family protein [Actinomycetota bacterium]|nr:SIR2 family protein [Actinomycetota bacterium]
MSDSTEPRPRLPDLDKHATDVARKLLKGIVTPLLGAGVNACGRPVGFNWTVGDSSHLPVGRELAHFLAAEFDTPVALADDLLRVSQFIEVVDKSGGELYQTLHQIFDADYPPGPVHELLADVASILRRQSDRGTSVDGGMQVILTTNYDDALERAFDAIGEPYDLITYVVASPKEYRGCFMHWPPSTGGEPRRCIPIERANEYAGLDLRKRTAIVKLHGAVRRSRPFGEDNYVITEDHYVDYLTRTDISQLLPSTVNERLKNSHLLFLGYGLADWNLRAILRRIWSDQELEYGSWAIQKPPAPADEAAKVVWNLEQAFWEGRAVEILGCDLGEYSEQLRTAFDARVAKVLGT